MDVIDYIRELFSSHCTSIETTLHLVMKEYGLSEEEARKKIDEYFEIIEGMNQDRAWRKMFYCQWKKLCEAGFSRFHTAFCGFSLMAEGFTYWAPGQRPRPRPQSRPPWGYFPTSKKIWIFHYLSQNVSDFFRLISISLDNHSNLSLFVFWRIFTYFQNCTRNVQLSRVRRHGYNGYWILPYTNK